MRRQVLCAAFVAAVTIGLVAGQPVFADGPGGLERGAIARMAPPVPTPPPPPPAPAAAPKVEAPPAVVATPVAPPPPPPAAEPASTAVATATAVPATGVAEASNLPFAIVAPQGWRVYTPEEARTYLRSANAALPAGEIAGMIALEGTTPTAADFWGTVISYQPIGYVPPENAAYLSAPAFVNEVRAARQQAGRPFEGFATPATFDSNSSALSWAERTATSGRNFRHEQRVLGRPGVIGLTTVALASQQPAIAANLTTIRNAVSFSAPQRYRDVTPGDATARFDLPGLITGREKAGAVASPAASGTGVPVTTNATTPQTAAGLGSWLPWLGLGLLALILLGWLLMGGDRRRRREEAEFDRDEAQRRRLRDVEERRGDPNINPEP